MRLFIFIFILILIPLVTASSLAVYPTKIYFSDENSQNVLMILTEQNYTIKSDLDIFDFYRTETGMNISLKQSALPKGYYQGYVIIQESGAKLSPAIAVKAFVNITQDYAVQNLENENSITSFAVSAGKNANLDKIFVICATIIILLICAVLLREYIPKNIFRRLKCRRH